MAPLALVARVLAGRDLIPVENGVVIVGGGRIQDVGSVGEIRIPAGTDAIDAPGLTLVPGFIDAHVHIAFGPPAAVLAGGVTTARDLAWPPEVIFPLVAKSNADSFEGPTLLAAGPMLTAPGGYPLHAAWAPPGTGRAVASAEEGDSAVGEISDLGAAVIKVALNPPVGPSLPEDVLKGIVHAAHRRGLRVSAHVYGLAELAKAVEAGVDELAHMLMSPERIPSDLLDEMVARDMAIVPTLSIRFGHDQQIAIENLRAWIVAGGRVVYGTDLGNEGPRPGIDPREIEAMAAAGMSARAVIAAATVDAAEYLRLSDVGFIAPGTTADLVAVRGNPLESLGAVGDVVMVWRRGRRVL